MDAKGAWVRANFTISGETVTLQLPSAAAETAASVGGTAVRYGWEQWARKMTTLLELVALSVALTAARARTNVAECALYNGQGAPGTGPNGTQPKALPGATGIAATPFCWNGTAPCPVL